MNLFVKVECHKETTIQKLGDKFANVLDINYFMMRILWD